MMRWSLIVAATMATVALAGCTSTSLSRANSHHSARILLRIKDGKCAARTLPHHHELEAGVEDTIVWEIKDKADCLNGKELVLKWVDKADNPTVCTEISTSANGSKSKIHCDLVATPRTDHTYTYKVYLRDSSGDVQVEDPEIEIAS